MGKEGKPTPRQKGMQQTPHSTNLPPQVQSVPMQLPP